MKFSIFSLRKIYPWIWSKFYKLIKLQSLHSSWCSLELKLAVVQSVPLTSDQVDPKTLTAFAKWMKKTIAVDVSHKKLELFHPCLQSNFSRISIQTRRKLLNYKFYNHLEPSMNHECRIGNQNFHSVYVHDIRNKIKVISNFQKVISFYIRDDVSVQVDPQNFDFIIYNMKTTAKMWMDDKIKNAIITFLFKIYCSIRVFLFYRFCFTESFVASISADDSF